MKFKTQSQSLLKQLNVASGAIISTPILAITEDFLLSLKGNDLSITATDLETIITTKASVEGIENGSAAVPAKIFLEALKALPNQNIEIEIGEKSLKLKTEKGEYEMAVDKPDDFPPIPEVDGEEINIPLERIMDGISYTIFATSPDEMKPHMQGVNMAADEGGITFVSTDGSRLTKYSAKIETGKRGNITFPKKALQIIKNALPQTGEAVLRFSTSFAYLKSGETEIYIRLISQKFPDFNMVIPKNADKKLHASRTELLGALRRINIFANRTTNQVLCEIKPDHLNITTKDDQFSNKGNERVDCDFDGGEMNIAFNAKFLVECLSAMSQEEIHFDITSEGRPVLIVPDTQDEGEEVMMLVMPVLMI